MAGERRRWGAQEIRRLRRDLGLSQQQMAAALGVRQQTISEWETGAYTPRGASLRVLALLAERRADYRADPTDGQGEGASAAPRD